VCLSVGLSVCLSICPRGYPRNHTSDLCQVFMRVAYVRGSVRLRHVYDRPYHLSPGRVFFLNENALSAGKGDGSAQRGRSMLSTIVCLHLSRVSTASVTDKDINSHKGV